MTPTCGDLSPAINFGGDGDAERFMCELSHGHGGAHQHNQDPYSPMRWIYGTPSVTPDSGQLRDELAVWLVQNFFWGIEHGRGGEAADMLLSGPLRRLIAERDRYAAQVQAVRKLADVLEREHERGWTNNIAPRGTTAQRIRRALDGGA